MQLTGKAYDVVRWTAQILLPALASLYFGLSQILGLPGGEEVVGCLALVTTFLGTLLGVSAANYRKNNEPQAGYLTEVGKDENGMPHLAATFVKTPDQLLSNDTVTFKIQKSAA